MAGNRIRRPMRIAVLHDHMSFIGGGERVVLTLASAFDADLYVTDLDQSLPERAGMPAVRATEIARVPQKAPMRQNAQARAFRDASIPDHDVYVLSGNWAVFAAPRLRPNLWYCHTPVRVFYDLRDSVLGSLSPVRRAAARRWIERRRPEYEAAVEGVDTIVANSQNVSGRIRQFLGRTSEVVYPPVDTARYRFVRVGDFWLSVNRLSHEKRMASRWRCSVGSRGSGWSSRGVLRWACAWNGSSDPSTRRGMWNPSGKSMTRNCATCTPPAVDSSRRRKTRTLGSGP